MEFSKNSDVLSITRTSRKLKENGYNLSNEKRSEVDLEDYRHHIDPVPSSKASIKHGPIEHGTPLMPYIPKPPPPGHP
ncbi:QWRF motif-containing protein 2-like [Hibiscus syriacus]|uniref:QWRF motif-containing protein 2-like n=2 Tax=Hibiscus syriacus TaxID=106335 RepID=A0A6A3CE91_HIBSY|nr:QWRF motif-containing protein 2-like [Hibiscus syriacus]